MTRDGPRLLLVFERMSLGDLRSYLRARAPTSSSYSQFPPALTEDELRLIVRQVALRFTLWLKCNNTDLSQIVALGVTMWEVFSYGEVPFAELNNFEMVSYAMAG
ncbi:hypothetical protein ANCCEY_03264, partial [Ancylostoma ceylanicum]